MKMGELMVAVNAEEFQLVPRHGDLNESVSFFSCHRKQSGIKVA